jgi:hypothetical protein
MTQERERHRHDDSAAPGGPAEPGELESARREGSDLLAAGDAAIQQTLSGNSEAWLRANRQEGGQ